MKFYLDESGRVWNPLKLYNFEMIFTFYFLNDVYDTFARQTSELI